MNADGGYFTQLARIIMYLGQIAANQVKEVATSVQAHVEGIVRTMKITAVVVVGVPLILLGVAIATENGFFISLAGMFIVIPALLLHWVTRPLTLLIELLDVPMPDGAKRRVSGVMRVWHSSVLGFLYTMATVSLFYTMLPFSSNVPAMIVVTLAMIALWVAGRQIRLLGDVFQAVGYLFLIATFLFSCYWALFPKSAEAFREYLRELDAQNAGEMVMHPSAATTDGPRPEVGMDPLGILMTEMKLRFEWGVPYKREPDRVVTCFPDVMAPTATGIFAEPGDVVYFAAKGKMWAGGDPRSPYQGQKVFGPEGSWPDFMTQQRLETCMISDGEVVYNLLWLQIPKGSVTPNLAGLVGKGVRAPMVETGMIHVVLNSPAYVETTHETGAWIFKSTYKTYDRPLVYGSVDVAIWIDRQRS